jgi:curved DNA-binding protein CbpA
MTHYEVLQVSRLATREVIEAAWKILMRQHHPDKGGDPKRAQLINEAHDVLSDPRRRAAYDLTILTEKRKSKTIRMPKPEQAYPEAYPGHPGLPTLTESMREVLEQLEGDLSDAVSRANMAVLERLAKSNPMLQIFLKQLKDKAKRRAG